MSTKKTIRENIALLKKNKPHTFGRFIMALKNLEDSDDWYRICGIHGNTFKPDDPGVLCPTDPAIVEELAKTGEPLYCAHSVEPFIAWHVPYLYEFEKLLNIYNRSRVKTYLTLPFFDITDLTHDYSFLNEPHIHILYDKEEIYIRNPLASAFFYPHGIKTPITRNGCVQPFTPTQFKHIKTLHRQLHDTLHAKTYEEFSSQLVSINKTYKPYPYVPLETPHNSIHDFIGGDGGNMSYVDISAFDPIFWLHHANMDRFFYNWLKDKNLTAFSQKSLQSTLAPFSTNHAIFGWENCSRDFIILSKVIPIDQYPYSYPPIHLKTKSSASAFLFIIDLPIPPETVTFTAFIHPKDSPLLDKELWYAGSATWFGINQSEKYCNRCTKTRTNLPIDVLDFVKENHIHKDNTDKWTVSIECKGKLIQNIDGTYNTYPFEDLLRDGSISFDIHP